MTDQSSTRWQEEVELDGEGPVYDQIKRAVLSNIQSGLWETGHRLPAEADLAEHLAAARMTVNRALRELSDEGLIVRKRRLGSFVANPPAPSAMLEIVDMSSEIPGRGQSYSYRCLTQDIVPARGRVAEAMQLTPETPVRHIICVHEADGVIVELEERWINLALLPEAEGQDFSEFGPGGWLLSATPWTEAEHIVRAVNADAALAARLDSKEGSACLVLERRTFQADEVVTLARLTHPGDRHELSERFVPDESGAGVGRRAR